MIAKSPIVIRTFFSSLGAGSATSFASRPVPIMVPVYDYCVPGKECSTNSDSPCEMFEKIAFPTVEFFPRGLEEPHCKEENDTEGQGEAQG